MAQIEEQTRCAGSNRPPATTSFDMTLSVEARTARLLHLCPFAEHVCCRLSEDQDQFHEISRFHLVAERERGSSGVIDDNA